MVQNKVFSRLCSGNFRLDPLQAAVLTVKLPLLDSQHDGRRKNAEYYNKNLKTVKTPVEKDDNWMIYNQYTVRTEKEMSLLNI